MKKRNFLALALAVMLASGLLAGCNVNKNEFDDVDDLDVANQDQVNDLGEDNKQGGDVGGPKFNGINSAAKYRHELGLEPGSLEGRTLTVWTFWDISEEEQANMDAFEAATGCKFIYVNKLYETYQADLLKAVATGEGPDICVFMSEVVPAWVMKGYLTPVSDYIDFSKVSFPMSEGTKAYYTFNSKLYVIPDLNVESSKLYFRKDIFANASLSNPYDLWLEGKWTWDAFVDLAQRVKEANRNSDGDYDVWGYYSWQQEQIFFSNGANFVLWEDGKPFEGLSDPKAIRALEWERALGEQYDIISPYPGEGIDPPAMLVSGMIAMMYWGDWLLYGDDGLRTKLGDKLGIAPFPLGPDATAPFGEAASGHKEGISGAAKEPEIAALFMLFKRLPIDEADEAEKLAKEIPDRIRDFGSLEIYDMCVQMSNYAIHDPRYGFTGLDSVVSTIRGKEDMTPAQAVEAYKGVAQSFIDQTWNAQ